MTVLIRQLHKHFVGEVSGVDGSGQGMTDRGGELFRGHGARVYGSSASQPHGVHAGTPPVGRRLPAVALAVLPCIGACRVGRTPP